MSHAGLDPAGLSHRDYHVIIDRNPFGLRPPPPPKTNSVAPATPPPEFILTGITSFGREEAYFMTKPRNGGAPEYFDLSEGEKEDGLEVLQIDPEERSVRVRRGGVVSIMDFRNSGVQPPSAGPANAAAPGTRPAAQAPTLPGYPNRTSYSARTSPWAGRSLGQIPTRFPGASASRPTTPRPYAAEQDVLLMELQKAANPNVVFPPTPMPP